MIKSFTVYLSSGEILRSGSCLPSDIKLQAGPEELVLEGEGRDDTHWVDVMGPTVMEKTDLPVTLDKGNVIADGVDSVTLTIPIDVTVSLNGQDPIKVTDDTLLFRTVDKGNHTLLFEGVKYLPKEITIGAI